MDKKTKKATPAQRERIKNMLESGLIDRKGAQEMITRTLQRRKADALEALFAPPQPFRLPLTYAPVPPKVHLERVFGGGSKISRVSDAYDGRPWTRHASCECIQNPSPGERLWREIVLAPAPQRFLGIAMVDCLDDIASSFGEDDLRFAIVSELVEIGEYRPEIYRHNFVHALGSTTIISKELCIPVLCPRHALDVLDVRAIRGHLTDADWLLLIRKDF